MATLDSYVIRLAVSKRLDPATRHEVARAVKTAVEAWWGDEGLLPANATAEIEEVYEVVPLAESIED